MSNITDITANKFLGYGITEDKTWCQLVFETEHGKHRVEFPAKQLVDIAPHLHNLALSIYQQSTVQDGTNPGNVAQTSLIQPGKVQIGHTLLTTPPAVTIQIQPESIAPIGYIFSQEQAEWMIKEISLALDKCKSISAQPLN